MGKAKSCFENGFQMGTDLDFVSNLTRLLLFVNCSIGISKDRN